MEEMFYKILGASIRDARKKRGFSQQQVADRLQTSRSCIANWEQGRRNINVVEILKLCEILNIPYKELVEKAEKYLWR